MKKSKNTKRALWASLLSMFLCIAMLIGSTYAWFTDSVTSGKNKIVAGNLDVELEYSADGQDWQKVDEKTELFKALEADGNTNNLWEPGHTEVVYLKVSNVGTLALKYQLAVNVVSETVFTNALGKNDCRLSDYLVFGQVVSANPISAYPTREEAWNAVSATVGLKDYAYERELLMPDTEEYIALVVYMPTTVGNEANYRGDTAPSIDLGVNLVATQAQQEADSFGTDYDAASKYPVEVGDADSFLKALEEIEDNEEVVLTSDITVNNPITPITVKKNTSINFNGYTLDGTAGNGQTVLEVSSGVTLTLSGDENSGVNCTSTGSSVYALKNLGGQLIINGGTYTSNAGAAIYNDGGTVVINDGVFESTKASNYALTDANGTGNITINGGTFTGLGRALNLTSAKSTVVINDGTFTGGAYVVYSDSKNLTINGGTFTGGSTAAVRKGGGSTNLNISGGDFEPASGKPAVQLANAKVTANISGGVFNGDITKQGTTNGTIKISGGSFISNVSEYVKAGYQCKPNGDRYIVSSKD